MINYSIGLRVQELRTANNLTQLQLALVTGLTPSYLDMIEKDEKNPTVHCLSKICKGLNISIGEFFEEDSRVENPVVNKVVLGLNKLDESEQFQVLDYVRRLVNNKDR